MVIRKNISLVTIIFTVVLLVGLAGSSYCQLTGKSQDYTGKSQLLFRSAMERENYGRTGYHLYGRRHSERS